MYRGGRYYEQSHYSQPRTRQRRPRGRSSSREKNSAFLFTIKNSSPWRPRTAISRKILFHANDEVIAGQKRINYDDYATVDPFSPVYEVPVSDQLFVIQSKIIQRLAANGPCVIIGRCSDVIVEDAFRIFICSSFKKRVERIQGLEKEPEDLKKLESRIRAVDAKRRDYYQYYSGNEWGKPKNYDLCLNSGTLGIERCVEIIANSVTLG